MALRDRYAGVAAAPASTASSAVAPVASSVPSLAELRQKIAGGALGGVNPPEGAAKLTEACLEPRTRETPDGGAEPIVSVLGPNAGSVLLVAGPLPSTPTTEQAKRKRRTKAEMEAARLDAAEREAIVSECELVERGKVVLDSEPTVTDFSLRSRLDSITTDQLLGELLRRAQEGL